ncbi:MAG: BREX system P-loop protein BrxC [Candidatus Fermentibacteraceae bacterium]|nr:BREX system P-loop protein BrxC [Candidatus Fermentibacteraceae bacterium]
MTLKTLFKKPVNRQIEGVIKADDEANLRLELEEYVLTNEVAKRLESFLEAYNKYEGVNGVWISGFFGSGKSHLLKMLALILENKQIDGANALDMFLPKCTNNEILRADLNRAVSIPSKSILFNIDQKADVISKNQIDALLAVFVKVFDEMCGYYGKLGHIAQFERDLDSRSLFNEFKQAYQTESGKPWEKGREQALMESRSIAKAYAKVSGGDEALATGILDKYRKDYKVSIEDFADNVKAYLDTQEPNFRLNFFVDEVGQYIAENVKLMTNLQTIAESLATKCRGRAWIIVTSQNDMSTVLGEMNKQQTNDFSKIMARFAEKMLLTSKDVAEVIQKRLLSKTEEGIKIIEDLYNEENNNFGTLFTFTDGSRTYGVYKDRDEFIKTYPFVSYQFDLFQTSIEDLSRHNAFEGKHSSVGERSMLGVFQQVAVQISDYEIGQLASFDLMFEGIRTALKAQTQKAIHSAEKQLNNKFAVKLLKALFLVKYVKEFKATIRNLCILMTDGFNQDLPALRKNVEEALNLLEQQTFIQRNGDQYEFLTDEEKDVEQEIKNTAVETNDVASALEKIIFDDILKTRKIRYAENKQDYSFARKLDDRLYGRDYEIAINVITPFHEHAENETNLRMLSMKTDQLMVVLPADDRLMSDILMYKRTEKYFRQNITTTQQQTIRNILEGKNSQNDERLERINQRIRAMLANAKLFVNGNDIEIREADPQARITRGFSELITRAYPNLRMLRGHIFDESQVAAFLRPSNAQLGDGTNLLAESELELLAFIQNNKKKGMRTSLKGLLEKFEAIPFGWNYAAVLCTLAKLYARGKVEITRDGSILEDEQLEKALKNSREQANILIDPQIEFTASQIRNLKEFYSDFFDTPVQTSEVKVLGKDTSAEFQKLTTRLEQIANQTENYPFLQVLQPVQEKLAKINEKSYTWYLTELPKQADDLLDMKENIIDPVCKFMDGSQKKIYEKASNYLSKQDSNFDYIDTDEKEQITQKLNDPNCFRTNSMQQVKTLLDDLKNKVTTKLKEQIKTSEETINTLKERAKNIPEYTAINNNRQEQIEKEFDEFINFLPSMKLIAVIRERTRTFEETTYPNLLKKIDRWAQPEPEPNNTEQLTNTKVSEPPIQYEITKLPKVPFKKAYLVTEADVNSYLESEKEVLLKEIKKGKRIQI